MSRFGMGYGKDQAHHILSTRPAVRIHSARCQNVVNKWFQTGESQRPDWFSTQFQKEKRRTEDDGEWQLVWHPRSRMGTATVPARRILYTLKDEDEKERLKERLAEELTKPSRGGTEHEDKDDLVSEGGAKSGRRSRKLALTARSDLSAPLDDEDGAQQSHAPKSTRSHRSKASRRSKSSMSTTSTLTQNQDELISRIKGLEEALLGEKAVREKMQSLLTMEAWAKDLS